MVRGQGMARDWMGKLTPKGGMRGAIGTKG